MSKADQVFFHNSVFSILSMEMKKADLNTEDPEQAVKMIAGTARNMGIEVVE